MLLTNADFGILHETWNTAKQQARQLMIERARIRGMIPYSELVKGITAVKFEPYDVRLFHFLGPVYKLIDGGIAI